MTERAIHLLSLTGKSGSKLAVEPPGACDAAMTRDGIEAKPPKGTGERSWWLRQIVGRTPPSAWVEKLVTAPPTLIRAAHATSWAKELWSGWAEAAARVRDEVWALALLSDPPKDR